MECERLLIWSYIKIKLWLWHCLLACLPLARHGTEGNISDSLNGLYSPDIKYLFLPRSMWPACLVSKYGSCIIYEWVFVYASSEVKSHTMANRWHKRKPLPKLFKKFLKDSPLWMDRQTTTTATSRGFDSTFFFLVWDTKNYLSITFLLENNWILWHLRS